MSDKTPKQKQQVKTTLMKGEFKPLKANVQKKNIKKASGSTQKDTEQNQDILMKQANIIDRPYEIETLEVISRESTIIPQCIRAYKNNIPGFGYEIVPMDKAEGQLEESAKKTIDEATKKLEGLYLEYPLVKSYKLLIDQVERYGYGAYEVIRNKKNEVAELINIDDMTYFFLTKKDKDATEYKIFRDGQEFTRKKKFRRVVQLFNGDYTYYKEYGDPRNISIKDGKEIKNETTPGEDKLANEIIWQRAEPLGIYGVPRWEGPALTAQGMRLSEELNNKYFKTGRHIPLMILVKNGTLTDDAYKKLQEYMEDIEGSNGWNAFMLLEFDQLNADTQLSTTEKTDIEVKEMSKILQKDELFSDYQENGRKKIQSSFLLPDIYVAYTTDFNVATAITAVQKTEEQVFQPERDEYEMINNQILWEMGYKDLKFQFKAASVENSEHQQKMFDIAVKAGSMTPNIALSEYGRAVNKVFEEYPAEWGDKPIHVLNAEQMGSIPEAVEGIQKAIVKAETDGVDGVVSVLKELKKTLVEIQSRGE